MSDDDTTAETSADDDLKRKYREALDRKNAGKQGNGGGGPGSEGKVHGAHGSESHQKSFRRKAGG
jgi:Family of unknown function (DUF5302)